MNQTFPRAATPGANAAVSALQRVMLQSGGLLNADTIHPVFTPFEYVDRVYPSGAIHGSVSPSRRVEIAVSSYTVPKNQVLFVYDFVPNIFRFSGVDPEDSVPVEPQRFATQVGWDVTVGAATIGQFRYGLVPRIPTAPAPSSQSSQVTPYAVASANAAQGLSLGLLPQRPRRPGALNVPYTLLVKTSQTLKASAVIFRPIQSPIAFFEFTFAGFLIPEKLGTRLIDALEPRT